MTNSKRSLLRDEAERLFVDEALSLRELERRLNQAETELAHRVRFLKSGGGGREGYGTVE